jgi:hypothetical protein
VALSVTAKSLRCAFTLVMVAGPPGGVPDAGPLAAPAAAGAVAADAAGNGSFFAEHPINATVNMVAKKGLCVRAIFMGRQRLLGSYRILHCLFCSAPFNDRTLNAVSLTPSFCFVKSP